MQQLARKFTKEEITPNAAHYDKTGEVKRNDIIYLIVGENTLLLENYLKEKFGGVAMRARSVCSFLFRKGH